MKTRSNRRSPVQESLEMQRPLLRLADVIDEISALAADATEAARVINHMFSQRHIRFAEDFDPRSLRVKLH